MADVRPWVNGYFQLAIDGIDVGIVNKFGGGNISAEVAKIAQSTEYLVKNHLGNIKYDDMSVSCGVSMGKPFQDWIKTSLDSAHVSKNGAVIVGNFDRKAVQQREFKNALITEVSFPVADAAAKDATYLDVKWACETIRFLKGGGETIQKPVNPKQGQFKSENFRFTLDGFDKMSAKVSKIDKLTIKQAVERDQIGNARDYELVPGKVEMPNLKITFNESVVDDLAKYHEDFVIKGINEVAQEKTFLLEFLDQKRENVLLAIQGTGVGIFNLTRADMTNNESKIATCTAEFYVDEIKITEWNG